MELWTVFLLCFIQLFVAVDPLGTLPVFASVTAAYPPQRRRALVVQAVPTALFIGVAFFVLGRPLLRFLNIHVEDLQIAGGVLLFILAVIDLFVVGRPTVQEEASLGIVPLATPLIVGPAVLTLGLVLVDKHGPILPLAALICVIAILAVLLLSLERILVIVPLNAMRAMSKVVDLLLASIGVAFVREGVMAIIHNAKV